MLSANFSELNPALLLVYQSLLKLAFSEFSVANKLRYIIILTLINQSICEAVGLASTIHSK